MSTTLPLAAVLGFLTLSAFFSGTETALFSLSRFQLARLRKRGRRGAIILDFLKHPSRVLVGLIMGNVVVGTYLSSYLTEWTIRRYGEIYVGACIAGTAVLVLVMGEIIPKMIAVRVADGFALAIARPLKVYLAAVRPILGLFTRLAELAVQIVAPRWSRHASLTEQEILSVMSEDASGALQEVERRLLRRILSFGKVNAEHIMTPWPAVIAVTVADTRDSVAARIQETMHSRYPVWDADRRQVIGYLNAKEFLLEEGGDLRRFIKPVLSVAPGRRVEDMFYQMQGGQHPVAVVADEKGGGMGLVTMTDVLEEIVGSIPDEFDPDQDLIRRTHEGEFLAGGDAMMRDVEERLNVDLEIGGDPTVGGFLLQRFGAVPPKGARLRHRSLEFEVERADARKILEVRIRMAGEDDRHE